jgi:glucosamine-6-phosphate deaminase
MNVQTKIGEMSVVVCESNAAMGRAAAEGFATVIQKAAEGRDEIGVIFATGNSQLTFLEALRDVAGVPWEGIVAFHMDEYLGMSEDHPASFRRFVREKITDRFHPGATYGMIGDAPDIEAELAHYESLLNRYKPVVCVCGIGENGHLAFNDPPADFHTSKTIHLVTLDETCRRQQVGEGHFPTIDDVPRQAISLTIPCLLKAERVLALVPETRKAKIVQACLEGPVTEQCPGSILRTQKHVTLFLDRDSAALTGALAQR